MSEVYTEVGSTDPPVVASGAVSTIPLSVTRRSWLGWSVFLLGAMLDYFVLLVMIAVVAAVPILQFASLGYLLLAAARLADRQPWRNCLPGMRQAGRFGRFALLAGVLYLPVLLTIDLAYSAELMQPNTRPAFLWRLGAALLSGFWLVHVSWAAFRGGRWWQLLWPAPLRFFKEFWRPGTWATAGDRLLTYVVDLQLPKLWWLGARATIAAFLWMVIPVSLMIIGQRTQHFEIAPVLGLIGAVGLTWLMFYLPYLQIEFARTGNLSCFIQPGTIRKQFAMTPFVYALSLVVVCILAIPLYILRIEATPSDLLWLPSIVFVALMLPGKLALGWAMGRSKSRADRMLPPRGLLIRWFSKGFGLAGVLMYVGSLYLAQLVAGQGVMVMYFQHMFLAPNPLFVS